jgi:hypothetical protein
MKFCLLVTLFLLSQTFLLCQVYKEIDVKVYESKIKLAQKTSLKSKPIGEVISAVGNSFLGTDYKAFTLERGDDEKLVVDLTGLDCTTFVETALAIAHNIKKDSTSFDNFIKELTYIRYRGGIINKYPSRLHYFSDWIYDNAKKKVTKDITKDLGGEPIRFDLDFMSTHPDLYKHLIETPANIPIIKSQEDLIYSRTYYYLPKNKIKSVEAKLLDGDIIAFTTSVKGLDVSHTGIAVRLKDGSVHLLHAPQPNTKVQITKEPLSEYILKLKKDTGIIVSRALEP